MRALLPVLLVGVALAAPVAADEVWLKNGSSITGRATEQGELLVIAVRGGTLRLPRTSVDRVDRGPLPDELFAERSAATDQDDPEAVRSLGRYAAELGMSEAARRLERTADEVDFERRVAAVAPGDAAGYRGLAWLASVRGLGRNVERYLYRRALGADPKDEESRRHLGRLDREEHDEERRRAEEAERAAHERTAAERAALVAEVERARAEAARARQEAERERERREVAERARRAAEERPWMGSGREVYGPAIIFLGRRRRPCGGATVITPEGPVFVPRGSTYPHTER